MNLEATRDLATRVKLKPYRLVDINECQQMPYSCSLGSLPTLLYDMCTDFSVLQANPNFETRHRKKRVVTCKHCGGKDHYKMSSIKCALFGQATSLDVSAIPSDLNSLQNPRNDTRGQQAARYGGHDDDSGENDNGEEDNSTGDELPPHTNIFGNPVHAQDAFNAGSDSDDDEDNIDPNDPIPQNLIWHNLEIHENYLRNPSFDRYLPQYYGKDSSPINIPEGPQTPLDLFNLFMTSELLQTFVNNTNSYASKMEMKYWKPITNNELLNFFGIITYFGIVKVPVRRLAWAKSSLFRQDIVCKLMKAYRFEQILKALHYLDTSALSETEKAERKRISSFWQVDGLLFELSKQFRRYYNLGQKIDIDEMCVYFKGRHISRCYNPKKPEKWHFKFFSLNDSKTSYLYSFYPYQGQREQRPAEWNATAYPIYKLLDPLDELKRKNHILCVDNWYNQLLVAKYVRSIGMHSTGTIKTNKRGLPKEMLFKKTGRQKKNRGDMASLVTTALDSDNEYYLTMWMDTKPVHMLSTFRTSKSSIIRNGLVNGKWERIRLDRPSVVGVYNAGMGGTDLFDQYCTYYRTTIKTKKWTTRIITHMVMCCLVNAYVIYKHANAETSLLDFLDIYISELLHEQEPQRNVTAILSSERTRQIGNNRLDKWYDDTFRLTGQHFCASLQRKAWVPTSEQGHQIDPRKPCILCKTKCATICNMCKVHLCISDPNELSCFEKFHSLEDIKNL